GRLPDQCVKPRPERTSGALFIARAPGLHRPPAAVPRVPRRADGTGGRPGGGVARVTRPGFRPFDLAELPTVEEALARWLDALPRPVPPTESVDVTAAVGRVLAEDVVAQGDVPHFPRSQVDGVALRAEDTASASQD